jgi:threonine/homoserine/homoserine lactone efflux protein
MDARALLPYLGACVLLTLAPGPDNIFVVTQGLARGRWAALCAAWGMVSGILVHTTAAALGVSAIFAASPLAFHAVKYAGALYLLYLAWRTLREGGALHVSGRAAPAAGLALYRRGFLMNVLNPKVALFFLAFLPQFVQTAAGVPVWLQMIILGLMFMAQAFGLFSLIAVFSGTLGELLTRRPGVRRLFGVLTAAVFIGLAAHLALASR